MSFKLLLRKLLAFGAGVLLLVLSDFGLGIFGVEPLSQQDRFAGFSASQPTVLEVEPGVFELNPAKAHYFNIPQSFRMPKPAGVFRVVVFGGSTTYGRPYLQRTSFGAWFEKLIERYAPGSQVEVLNLGGISYASYRVRRVLEEMAQYEPDLYLLYSGHNEFLEARTFADLRAEPELVSKVRSLAHHSRIYSLLTRAIGRGGGEPDNEPGGEVKATLEQIGGPELYRRDAGFRAGVIRQYREEMTRMARFCQEREIPLVISTLPVNLGDMSPFKSEHRSGLTAAEYQRWNQAYRRGVAELEASQYAAALEALQRAEKIDDRYAQLHFLIGKAAWGLGNASLAYRAFDRARQEDIVPLRALDEFNQIIREVAASQSVPLADVERFFLRVSPDNIPGHNLFADHVHPTIEGQQLVAWVMLNAATRAGLVPLRVENWQSSMTEARSFLRSELDQIGDRYLAMGLWGVGRLFFWAGKYPEAYVALERAWSSVKDIPEIPLQLAKLEMFRGRPETALFYLDSAAALQPDDPQLRSTRISALIELKRLEEARTLLLQGNQGEKSAEYDYLLGKLAFAEGRSDEAAAAFRAALQLAPEVNSFRLALAEALRQGGRSEEAIRVYSAYLSQRGDSSGELPPEDWIKVR